MNFFILYVSLPALFFRILSKTPFEQLAQIDFVKATVLATAAAFFLSFLIGLILARGRIADATLAAVAGGFGNVGYMGPGPGARHARTGRGRTGGPDLLLRCAADLRPHAAADGLRRRPRTWASAGPCSTRCAASSSTRC